MSLRLHAWLADGEFTCPAVAPDWNPTVEICVGERALATPPFAVRTASEVVAYPNGKLEQPTWMQYLRVPVLDAGAATKHLHLRLFSNVDPSKPRQVGVATVPFAALRRGVPVGFVSVTLAAVSGTTTATDTDEVAADASTGPLQTQPSHPVGTIRIRLQLQYSQSVVVPPTHRSMQTLHYFEHYNNHPEILLGLTGLAGFRDQDVLRFKISCGSEIVRVDNALVAGEVQVPLAQSPATVALHSPGAVVPSLTESSSSPSLSTFTAARRRGHTWPGGLVRVPAAKLGSHDAANVAQSQSPLPREALTVPSNWREFFWVSMVSNMVHISVRRKNVFGVFERVGVVEVNLGENGRDFASEKVDWREVLSPSGRVVGRIRLSVQVQYPESVIIPPGSSKDQVRHRLDLLLLDECDVASLRQENNQIVSLLCSQGRPRSYSGQSPREEGEENNDHALTNNRGGGTTVQSDDAAHVRQHKKKMSNTKHQKQRMLGVPRGAGSGARRPAVRPSSSSRDSVTLSPKKSVATEGARVSSEKAGLACASSASSSACAGKSASLGGGPAAPAAPLPDIISDNVFDSDPGACPPVRRSLTRTHGKRHSKGSTKDQGHQGRDKENKEKDQDPDNRKFKLRMSPNVRVSPRTHVHTPISMKTHGVR